MKSGTNGATGNDALRLYDRSYRSRRALLDNARAMQEETALRWITETAAFAAAHHPGRFFDGALENVALDIGAAISDAPLAKVATGVQGQRAGARGGSRRSVLHVSPFVYHVGGHTRTLANWIRNDRESRHSVVLFNQSNPEIPEWIREEVRKSGGELTVLPPALEIVQKARLLRMMAQSTADVVVLHHVCWDVTPVVAFAGADLPPVAFVNDCDQAFWLGGSIADLVVNQREAGARLNSTRRFAAANVTLPIPLSTPADDVSRESARRALGIPDDQHVFLTIGRATKYRPGLSLDFFGTMRKVLDREAKAHLYVVGLSADDANCWRLDYQHPRIHLCGAREPQLYRAAADLYLESFPFGSATALLETALAGVPVVLPYSPPLELLVTNHGLEQLVHNPKGEDEYIESVCALSSSDAHRLALAGALQEHVRAHHVGVGWSEHLESVYGLASASSHRPRRIPSTACEETDVDVVLSGWHASLNGDTHSPEVLREESRNAAFRNAYESRKRGDFRGAYSMLEQFVRSEGFDRRALMSIAKLPAHVIYQKMGRCF